LICCIMKNSIRAAQKKERGRMRPAGRQFDMPALEHRFIIWGLWTSKGPMGLDLGVYGCLKSKVFYHL